MPSKTWSIMACNTPIIASFDTDSELADILRTSETGICVEPEDAAALAEAIEQAKAAENKTQNGRAYVMENASREVCTKKYVEVLQTVIENSKK